MSFFSYTLSRKINSIAGCLLLAVAAAPLISPDSPSNLTPICGIQGSGFHSPHTGRSIRTQGIVYGDMDNSSRRGFFIQSENCDGNPSTSDGVFVYLGERINVVDPGDHVEVVGQVQEYFGLTEIVINPGDVAVLSKNNALPPPVELNPPFDNLQSSEYFERLEGMRVSLKQATTVGPTDTDDRSWLVHTDLGIGRIFTDDPRGTGEIICVDDDGPFEINPEVKVGDRVANITGVQDYKGGEFCLQLFAQPSVFTQAESVSGSLSYQAHSELKLPILLDSSDLAFSLATFNMANLFDTIDDPLTEDTRLSASEYQRRLGKRARAIHDVLGEPEIIALQEVENDDVLQALLNHPEIVGDYKFVWQNGPDRRGMDLALIYRVDRVQIIENNTRQGCTRLIDGLGPDGNRDVYNPYNDTTCDTDNDGQVDGNRLFSRPPQVVRLRVCTSECPALEGLSTDNDQILEIYMINNHWKSKLQDTETTQYTLPRRIEQAYFVASIVDDILVQDPYAVIVLLGDLNANPGAQPISIVKDKLDNLFLGAPPDSRYTYIYHGLSQILDYVLVRPRLPFAPVEFTPHHINADYPVVFHSVDDTYYRSSDHDILQVEIMNLKHTTYLPMVNR